MKNMKNTFKEISKYPSAIFGAIIILLLVALAIYAVFSIPYDEAIRLWRGGEDTVYRSLTPFLLAGGCKYALLIQVSANARRSFSLKE